jgi:hypothetical protein
MSNALQFSTVRGTLSFVPSALTINATFTLADNTYHGTQYIILCPSASKLSYQHSNRCYTFRNLHVPTNHQRFSQQ